MPRRGGQRGAPCRGSADRDVVVGGAVIRSRVKWAWHCTLDLDVLGDSHVNLTIKSGVIETVREFFKAILLLSLFYKIVHFLRFTHMPLIFQTKSSFYPHLKRMSVTCHFVDLK
jgi:hypothetical protein